MESFPFGGLSKDVEAAGGRTLSLPAESASATFTPLIGHDSIAHRICIIGREWHPIARIPAKDTYAMYART